MFDLIKVHFQQPNSIPKHSLKFVDLGSGDGRVVFRAAREGLFHASVGYEINPTLHLFAQIRKLMTPKYWSNTRFECRDLWNIPLNNYDVVAVYGLSPIMDRLGKKMKEELKPGSIVVSNVFMIPGWKTVASCKTENGTELGGKGVYLYRIPESFSSRGDS
jgi:SAM-dependent methyltransferase